MPMMVWPSLSIWTESMCKLIEGAGAGSEIVRLPNPLACQSGNLTWLENTKMKKQQKETKCGVTFLLWSGELIHMSIDVSAELLNSNTSNNKSVEGAWLCSDSRKRSRLNSFSAYLALGSFLLYICLLLYQMFPESATRIKHYRSYSISSKTKTT